MYFSFFWLLQPFALLFLMSLSPRRKSSSTIVYRSLGPAGIWKPRMPVLWTHINTAGGKAKQWEWPRAMWPSAVYWYDDHFSLDHPYATFMTTENEYVILNPTLLSMR